MKKKIGQAVCFLLMSFLFYNCQKEKIVPDKIVIKKEEPIALQNEIKSMNKAPKAELATGMYLERDDLEGMRSGCQSKECEKLLEIYISEFQNQVNRTCQPVQFITECCYASTYHVRVLVHIQPDRRTCAYENPNLKKIAPPEGHRRQPIESILK